MLFPDISAKRFFTVIFMFTVTWLGLQYSTTFRPVAIKQPLSLFPKRLGAWERISCHRFTDEILNILKMDDYLDCVYREPGGRTVELYVAFYGAVGVKGEGYHSPKNCMPGSGWGIDSVRSCVLPVGIEGQTSSTVAEMTVRNNDLRRLVIYWYQNRGRIIHSEIMEKVFLVLDSLFMKRRDGTFVRLTMDTDTENDKTADYLIRQFSMLVMKKLEDFIPGKNVPDDQIAHGQQQATD